ncbi:MAG TPA: hypothetical protein DDZ90_17960, partial [Planctomycetaceae bacterium]|nr:hypothetical protein [Planctomycetaceae bacterium]
IADCKQNDVGFDSFSWTVQVSLQNEQGGVHKWDSAADFRGPEPEQKNLSAQAAYAFELALCRQPSPEELLLVTRFINSQLVYLQQHPEQLPKDVTPGRQVMTNLCQALMSSNEFLYVD